MTTTIPPANFPDPFALLLDPLAAATPAAGGTYSAAVNRQRPACILFVCDQSASMDEPFRNDQMKARALAQTVNAAIYNLVGSATMSDGCRHYFDVGVIGYGGNDAGNALQGPLGGDILQPITAFERHQLRIEDQAAGAATVKMPVWLDARASGGTPMCTALRKAREVVERWCTAHPDSFPPIVIHVTDGQSTDGNPEAVARDLTSTGTSDGRTLLFNLHIASTGHPPQMFCAEESQLADPNARLLFRMSSPLVGPLQTAVAERGYAVTPATRFFGYNADMVSLVQFMQLGSAAAQAR